MIALLCQVFQVLKAKLSCAIYHTALFDKGTLCQEAVLNRANIKRAGQLMQSME